MKVILLVFSVFLFTGSLQAQHEPDFIKLIFSQKQNIAIVEPFHPYPKVIFLLTESQTWDCDRFVSKKHPGRHAESRNPYIFSDSLLNQMIPEKDKESLPEFCSNTKSSKLTTTDKKVHLIASANKIKGYVFESTTPILTPDSIYAFIDLYIYYKDKSDASLKNSYYGTVSFVFKQTADQKWALLRKIEDLLL